MAPSRLTPYQVLVPRGDDTVPAIVSLAQVL